MKACFYFLFVYLQRLFTFTTMRKRIKAIMCAAVLVMPLMAQREYKLFPANGSTDVNPDTHLSITFEGEARVGQKGFIKVFDKSNGRLVDELDLSIPAGPTERTPDAPDADYIKSPYVYESKVITNKNTRPGTPSSYNRPDPRRFQLTIIGGFSDGFHFYPVMTKGNKATIYLHHNLLDYDKEYYVTIDKGVFADFPGIKGKHSWTFKTKSKAPDKEQRTLTVAADGSGDFSTLQGAMDFIPDFLSAESERRTVLVRKGDYQELVYFRNKNYVTIQGEGRNETVVHYPNNEVFNPHPADIKTNEMKGTFPSRRAAVAADNCRHMIFKDITFKTDCTGQAEGFLLNGDHNYAENVGVIGSGDALQVNGSTYWMNCFISGHGDTILGRGPSFFNHCTLVSTSTFMWIRNTSENHGNVFVSCTFKGLGNGTAYLAKTDRNKQKTYPHQEAVLLNCTLDNVPDKGWSHADESLKTAHLWEFNSVDTSGNPIDTSRRNPYSRQLDPVKDATLIGKYADANFVLGWFK